MFRSLVEDPDDPWTLTNHLLAAAVDALHDANWQRSGSEKAPRPKKVERPGVVDDDDVKRIGSGSRTPAEIDAILARTRARDEMTAEG